MLQVILWEEVQRRSTHGLSALPTFLRLSSFKKYESLTTEKLVQQENAHEDHAIYYSESMRTELTVCTLHMQRLKEVHNDTI